MRLPGLGLSDRVPDTPHDLVVLREAQQGRGDLGLFDHFDATLRPTEDIAISGQIMDASLVARRIGRRAPRSLDKAKERPDRPKPPIDLAMPGFRYQNYIGIDRAFVLIRTWMMTDADTAVWPDSACRSAANEQHLARNGFVSRI